MFRIDIKKEDILIMEINLEKRLFGYDTEIEFYDVDMKHRMKLASLLRLFARLAGEDYTERGMSHVFLRERGYIFLVSKVAYKIFRMPRLEEKVKVGTWVIGTKGARFLRGYEMLSENGEKLISAESVWICVDSNDRKIVRPKEFPWQTGCYDNGEIPVSCQNIKSDNLTHWQDYSLKYTDIDGNGHLNNAIYGDIIANALTQEELDKEIDELYLNYSHEAYLGETLSIYRGDSDDTVLIAMVGDRPCFECKLKFK